MILYQDPFAITEIDFVPGPFRFQIEQQHFDFAVDEALKITGYLGPMLSQMPVLHSVSSSLILALVSRSCLVPESLCLPRPNCAARRVRGARRSRAPSGGAYGTPEDTRPAPIPEVDRERRWFITERLSLHLGLYGITN